MERINRIVSKAKVLSLIFNEGAREYLDFVYYPSDNEDDVVHLSKKLDKVCIIHCPSNADYDMCIAIKELRKDDSIVYTGLSVMQDDNGKEKLVNMGWIDYSFYIYKIPEDVKNGRKDLYTTDLVFGKHVIRLNGGKGISVYKYISINDVNGEITIEKFPYLTVTEIKL